MQPHELRYAANPIGAYINRFISTFTTLTRLSPPVKERI